MEDLQMNLSQLTVILLHNSSSLYRIGCSENDQHILLDKFLGRKYEFES